MNVLWIGGYFFLCGTIWEQAEKSLWCLGLWLCLARKANLVYYFQSIPLLDSRVWRVLQIVIVCCMFSTCFIVYNLLFLILHKSKQASKLINYITSANLESKQSGCKHRGNNIQTQHFPEGAYVNYWFLFFTSEGTAILIGHLLQKILPCSTLLELLNDAEKWWKPGSFSNN